MIELGSIEGVVCPIREVDRVVVAGDSGGKPALRAFPTMVDLDNGELLVGYDLARDHHAYRNGKKMASFEVTLKSH